MYAVLITFQSSASLADLEQPFTDHARAMSQAPGLVYKTWIHAGTRVGGFSVFTDRRAAEQYLGGSLFKQVKTNPAFSDFEIRHFEVVDSLSEITLTIQQRATQG